MIINIYKLIDWIDIDKINWDELSTNINAIHISSIVLLLYFKFLYQSILILSE